MLRSFGHPVATYCDMVDVSAHARAQHCCLILENDYNIMQNLQIECCMKNLTMFKLEPTTRSMLEHVIQFDQTVTTYSALQCCNVLRSNVSMVWPGL